MDKGNHPTPFLFSAAVKLGDVITLRPLQDAISSNSKQTTLSCPGSLCVLTPLPPALGRRPKTKTCYGMHAWTLGCNLLQHNLPWPIEPSSPASNSLTSHPQEEQWSPQLCSTKTQTRKQTQQHHVDWFKLDSNKLAHGGWHRGGNSSHRIATDMQNDSSSLDCPQHCVMNVVMELNEICTHLQKTLSMLLTGSCPCPKSTVGGSTWHSYGKGLNVA